MVFGFQGILNPGMREIQDVVRPLERKRCVSFVIWDGGKHSITFWLCFWSVDIMLNELDYPVCFIVLLFLYI